MEVNKSDLKKMYYRGYMEGYNKGYVNGKQEIDKDKEEMKQK